MLKKIILLCGIILMLAGCSSGKEESSKEISEYMPAEVPQEVSVQRDTGELLESTFMELWKSDTVYIDTEMTVEGNSDEKSMYKYIIAGDKKNGLAVLEMEQPDGKKVHYIINSKKIYDIDDAEKNYSTEDYGKTVGEFIDIYTKDMNLGISESLKLSDSGTSKFEGKEMEFEKYDVRVSGDSSEKITVTYYFKDEKPYSEVMQSERGKTVFLFKTVSDSIKDKDIFKISDEYSETD